MEVILPQAPFELKTNFLIATDAPRIVGVNSKENPVEVEGAEPPSDQCADGVGSVAQVPVFFHPDQNSDLAGAVAPVDCVITTPANMFPALTFGSSGKRINGPRLRVFCRQVLVEPALFLLETQGSVLSQMSADFRISEPADKSRQVIPVDGPQANIPSRYHCDSLPSSR